MDNKPLIFIPTYNEAGNVVKLYNHLKSIDVNIDILFLDDDSPDGTGKILEELSKKDENLFIIHRKEKLGIGSAHKLGLRWGFRKKYKKIITMDADGTHDPKYIKKLLYLSINNHLVITNRFVRAGSLNSWPLTRILITKIRHFTIKLLLGMPLDSSGAFRCYNSTYVDIQDILKAKDNGYSFFWESLFIFYKKKYLIKEIPVTLHSRHLGSSKISITDIVNAIYYLFKVYLNK